MHVNLKKTICLRVEKALYDFVAATRSAGWM